MTRVLEKRSDRLAHQGLCRPRPLPHALVLDREVVLDCVVGDTAQPFDGFNLGTDAYPDRSATLVIEVPALRGGLVEQWRGPGIDGRATVAIAGLPEDFWNDWAANHGLFPCGVDLVFTAGTELCALPRSIAVEV